MIFGNQFYGRDERVLKTHFLQHSCILLSLFLHFISMIFRFSAYIRTFLWFFSFDNSFIYFSLHVSEPADIQQLSIHLCLNTELRLCMDVGSFENNFGVLKRILKSFGSYIPRGRMKRF